MATLWITEVSEIGSMKGGEKIQAVKMPPVAEQTVTFTTTTQSAAFNADTKAIRVLSDANAHLSFGANPTATTANMKVIANVAEYFTIVNRGMKVAAVTGA